MFILIVLIILILINIILISSLSLSYTVIPLYHYNNNYNNNLNMIRNSKISKRYLSATLSFPVAKRTTSSLSYNGFNVNVKQRDTTLKGDSENLRNIKVVTDIDDTVKSSGGVKLLGIPLGGIDTQYKRGDFYPGVSQFMLELSKPKSKLIKFINNVSVLTARAKEFKFALALKPKDKICTAFRNSGSSNGFNGWGIGDVYYGSVMEWIFQNRKGIRKLENFEIMLNNDDNRLEQPASDYIFVGDTGELDEESSERIAMKYPKRLKAVFLHQVSDYSDRSKMVLKKDRIFNKIPFFYFQTYVGAAAKAFDAKFISEAGLQNVINQARKELNNKLPKNKNIQSTKWIELENDVAFAMKVKQMRGRGLDDFIDQDELFNSVEKFLKFKL